MQIPADLRKRLMERYGGVIDLNKDPRILEDLWAEMSAPAAKAAPFGITWMDSWVAHHVYEDNLKSATARSPELASVLRGLADLKFNERLKEIQQFLGARGRLAEPPDGGTPEPGVPPAGPAAHRFAVAVPPPPPPPPDGGTPEPGVPLPAGPASHRFAAAEPPDGGTPEPGVPPPAGPEAGFLRENPWILYWFISIKAPMLLDVIDAHITRRLDALQSRSVR